MKKETEPLNPQQGGTSQCTHSVLSSVSPEAVVIYCSDPRFQGAFQEFIEGTLGLAKGQYIPFVVAGGPGALARPLELPKEFKFMRERLDLFREHFKSIKRIVLLGHEDCAYYKALPISVLEGLLSKVHIQHLPRADMQLIAKVFTQFLSYLGMQVEFYYAKFANDEHTQVVFDKVG